MRVVGSCTANTRRAPEGSQRARCLEAPYSPVALTLLPMEAVFRLTRNVANCPQQPQAHDFVAVSHRGQRGEVGELRSCNELPEQSITVGLRCLEHTLEVSDRARPE